MGPVGAPVRSVWVVVGALRGARAVHPQQDILCEFLPL